MKKKRTTFEANNMDNPHAIESSSAIESSAHENCACAFDSGGRGNRDGVSPMIFLPFKEGTVTSTRTLHVEINMGSVPSAQNIGMQGETEFSDAKVAVGANVIQDEAMGYAGNEEWVGLEKI